MTHTSRRRFLSAYLPRTQVVALFAPRVPGLPRPALRGSDLLPLDTPRGIALVKAVVSQDPKVARGALKALTIYVEQVIEHHLPLYSDAWVPALS